VQLRHAGVDQHTPIGMVDDVHIDRHPLALGEQVGNADWRDGDFLFHGSYSTKCSIESAAQRCALAAVGGRVDSPSKRKNSRQRKRLKNAARTHRQLHAVLVAFFNSQQCKQPIALR
jgi:hypothetical protein